MKELVRHLWENNRAEILEKSLFNCHIKNLHSIMLLNCPGKTIRMFIAMPDNELYKNNPYNIDLFSVAMHPHHCNLTLHCIKGGLVNWTMKETDADTYHVSLKKYLYTSQILTDKMGFELIDNVHANIDTIDNLKPGMSIHLKADQVHTVVTHPNEISAWLVYEGCEDPDYKSYAYSNADLTKINSTGLYQHMSEEQIEELLVLVGLL